LLSLVVTFFADVVFGALIGHFGLLFLTLWLFVAALCLAVSGLAARAGMAASLVLILVLIALGNPSSAGPVPRPLLNGFYSGLNPVLPQGAALSALRGVQYFGNQGIAAGLLCLMVWALAGFGLLVATGLRWPHRRAATKSLNQRQACRPPPVQAAAPRTSAFWLAGGSRPAAGRLAPWRLRRPRSR
jgi:hypothetical protein